MLAAYGLPVHRGARAREPRIRPPGSPRNWAFRCCSRCWCVEDNGVVRAGGVERDLESAAQVRKAARSLRQRLRERQGSGRVRGFSVQKMVPRPGAHELMVGVASDPVFGPVILFGSGGAARSGSATWRSRCRRSTCCWRVSWSARTWRRAACWRAAPMRAAADVDAICLALVQVSQLLADVDEVAELEIDPLLADARGVLALDARMRVVPHRRHRGSRRFAIRPYPQELEQPVAVERPDHPAAPDPARRRTGPQRLPRLAVGGGCALSLLRHHAPSAAHTNWRATPRSTTTARWPSSPSGRGEAGEATTLGEVRAVADPDNVSAEFAIVVRSETQGQGAGPPAAGPLDRLPARPRHPRTAR
ncbi:MAG: acetate--CoA ligase family protein [Rhodopseudomonas palustris]|nr:acetate--CoA ligase family protein [Rhodopseudomonas palustris]